MKQGDAITVFLIGLIIASVIWSFVIIFLGPGTYKQGQIDALTGKVKYELVVRPDSTRSWEKIK